MVIALDTQAMTTTLETGPFVSLISGIATLASSNCSTNTYALENAVLGVKKRFGGFDLCLRVTENTGNCK